MLRTIIAMLAIAGCATAAPAPSQSPPPAPPPPSPPPEKAPPPTATLSADVPVAVAPPPEAATLKRRPIPTGDHAVSRDRYPAEAKRLGIGGTIRVRLVVGADGAVVGAKLLNNLGHGLDELALELAKTIVFQPALDGDDKPVAAIVIWSFDMTP